MYRGAPRFPRTIAYNLHYVKLRPLRQRFNLSFNISSDPLP